MIKKIKFILAFNKDLMKSMIKNNQTPFEWTVSNENGVQSRKINMR